MPWWSESDTFHDDPRWAAAAVERSVTVDQLQAAYVRLKSIAARHASNGWLTRDTAGNQCRPAVLERLAAKVLSDMAPLLHTRGDDCACFDGWQDGYAFVIHEFLKRNPHKRETERYRAQKRERQDPRIRAQAYQRDGGCCRYCRSGPLPKKGMGRAKDRRRVIHFDHVDPDKLAGPDLANLVTSCARCNDEKGARLPNEADMRLLPVPTDAQREEWLAREECARFDRPDNDNDNAPDNASNNDRALSRALSESLSLSLSGAVDEPAVDTGEVRPEPADEGQRQPDVLSTEGARSGRGGQPRVVGAVDDLGQPARSPSSPDPYTQRSRGGAGG